jgi:hypothetical protein
LNGSWVGFIIYKINNKMVIIMNLVLVKNT